MQAWLSSTFNGEWTISWGYRIRVQYSTGEREGEGEESVVGHADVRRVSIGEGDTMAEGPTATVSLL
jgi:hypothetical protein